MADSIKFSEEELKDISTLQAQYNQITMAAGQIALQELALSKRKIDLEKALEDTRTKENEAADALTKKYGKGSLDINTGEFTPAPEEKAEVTELSTEVPSQE